MVDSFKEALNRNIDIDIRDMKQYDKGEIIESESSKLDKKLEEAASYVRPETKKIVDDAFERLNTLKLTEEEKAYINKIFPQVNELSLGNQEEALISNDTSEWYISLCSFVSIKFGYKLYSIVI